MAATPAGARRTPARQARPAAGRGGGERRRRAPRRRAAPRYLVHETDNDLLLIVSGAQEAPARRARRAPGEAPAPAAPAPAPAAAAAGAGLAGSPWGSRLPVEVLVRIFALAVAAEGGCVPFLCRAARVCRLWYGAAVDAALWRTVSLGYCWTPPGRKWPPALEKRVLGTVQWLAANRFSHLRDFSLCHWKSHVPAVLKAVGNSCPLLASLKLSHCSGITTEALCALAEACSQLVSLNLQNSQIDSWAAINFLEVAGARIKQLSLTYSSRMSAIIAVLVSGCCPELRLLEVNAEIKQNTQHFQLPIEQLQAALPQLQVLRLLNIIYFPKPLPSSAPPSLGFPKLEELCLATTLFSFVDDIMLRRILCTSSQLRVLDLRGCFRVTPKGLEQLPCPDVAQLYLGLYYSAGHLARPLEGSPLLTQKWRHSLQELDLTGQSFGEEDLAQAMAVFTQATGWVPALHTLRLTGTKVALHTVRALIASCPALGYLDLSSCRHLPRGSKKAYRGPDEIRQCLQRLLTGSEEPDRPGPAV